MTERSFFVTGTDTAVGKTIVTAALISALRANGHNVAPMKPVQTGDADDLAVILDAAGLRGNEADRKRMCPYRLAFAASPHFAASREGVTISLKRIRQDFDELRAHHDGVIVEGAGGILTPLAERLNMLDVMTALQLPVVLVARPGLGTLNHTLLTVRELRHANLDIRAIYLNETQPGAWGEIEDDNLTTLRRLAQIPVVERFPFIGQVGSGLAERAGTCLAGIL